MTQFSIETVAPKIRKVTFSNPPVNVVGADTVAELSEVVDELGRDGQVQAVIFDSRTPGYFFDRAALARGKAQINRATLPPDADLRGAWTEFSELVTQPGFRTRLPVIGKLIAEIGLAEVERNLGHYAGIANEQA